MGNEVEVAFYGLHAIALAEKFHPEIILLDIGLPDIAGYEVAKRLHEMPWSRPMTLIAMTGHREKEDRRRIRTSGFHAHLVKPLVYKQVISLLASYPAATISFPQSDSEQGINRVVATTANFSRHRI
jgi:two-component system CheB/CheR fusion protein